MRITMFHNEPDELTIGVTTLETRADTDKFIRDVILAAKVIWPSYEWAGGAEEILCAAGEVTSTNPPEKKP